MRRASASRPRNLYRAPFFAALLVFVVGFALVLLGAFAALVVVVGLRSSKEAQGLPCLPTHTVSASCSSGQSWTCSSLVWAACALHAWKEKRVSDAEAAKAIGITVQRCLKLYGEQDEAMNGFYALVQHQGTSLARLHEAFTAYWLALLGSHPSTAAATYLPAVELRPDTVAA